MAVLLIRALCLLPLLFHVGVAQFLPMFGGIFGGNRGGDDSKPNFETDYKGGWELVSRDSKVSTMHLILMPKTNKAIMFDATMFGPSNIKLPATTTCRPVPDSKTKEVDCWAHAVEYDTDTAAIRPLKVLTNPWCSSGGLAADGTFVGTGGWKEGGKSVRYLSGCPTCDWKEAPEALGGYRWYATQQILPDGSFFLIGGRRAFSYEYLTAKGIANGKAINFPFMRETTDIAENNLYPFVHLSTDGNLFILSNNRSILFNPMSQKIIREFPILPGGSRNYPASAMSALLPIKLYGQNPEVIQAEVLVCGGAKSESFTLAEKDKTYLPALQDCGRIQITKPNAAWKFETMPSPRVMGDMLILPTADVLMLNGAREGTSGWGLAETPNLVPVIYSPKKAKNQRFSELAATTIPRMYHSSSAVLPDGKILVAGSNTHPAYLLKGAKYPTEMRVEKFSPPYLDPSLQQHKPEIVQEYSQNRLAYGQNFMVKLKLNAMGVTNADIKVTMYSPPFTTHGYSMNQRLLILGLSSVLPRFLGFYDVVALAPPSGNIAPPGYYLLYVVHRGVPSTGMWVHIQ